MIADTNTNATDYPVIAVTPDQMISQVMWKIVFAATGGILLWTYLKSRRED